MNIIQGFLECLTGSSHDVLPAETPNHGYQNVLLFEKANPHLSDHFAQSAHAAATKTVMTLQSAEKAGYGLKAAIDDIVTQVGGWTELIATSILDMLVKIVKEGSPMRQAMKEAFDRACDVAVTLGDFVHEHPILCTVIALGILILLAPAVIHALGFGALGPIEGSFAASWQSLYGGVVESGSLFSYLQKLGMLY